MPTSRSTAPRPASPTSEGVAVPKPRPVSSRLRLLLGIGLLLAVLAWSVRSSPWMREKVLREKDLPTLEEMTRLQPQDALTQRYFGLRCYQANRFEEALAAYETAARLNPNDATAHYGLGLALYRLGKTRRAQEEFERAFHQNDRLAGAEYMLGCLAWAQGDTRAGLERVRHATELAPDADRLWWGLARLYLQVDSQGDAIAALNRALSLREADPEYHTALAEALINSGRPQEARPHLERAMRLDFNYGQAFALLGSYYLHNVPGPDSLDKAEGMLRRAMQLEPLFPAQVAFDLGQVYAQKGDYRQAVEAFREAQRLGFQDETLYYALAKACRKTGETKAAADYERQFARLSAMRLQIPAQEQRLRAHPEDADTHLRLARAYRYLERKPQAIQHYSVYLRLRPQAGEVAQEADQYFQSVRQEAAKLLPESVLPEPL